MRRLIFQSLSAIAMTVSVLLVTPAMTTQADAQAQNGPSAAFARTQLFFGSMKPDGVVTDLEFSEFVDRVVTPRFPDGVTWLKGNHQFRNEDEAIIKHDSFILILLYPLQGFRESSRRINAIRQLYKEEFQQESVLRVDDPFAVRVSF